MGPAAIGDPPWERDELRESLDEFVQVYERRPIRENTGGIRGAHAFATWFLARKLAPDLIIESGVWRGQSTWLLEQACPTAELVSIDIDLSNRVYVSDRARYSSSDFSLHDWSRVTDRALAFFDDHQNALKRLQQLHWYGFKHAIFEDNYPPPHGDCYSLKRALAHAGFEPAWARPAKLPRRLAQRVLRRLAHTVDGPAGTPQHDAVVIAPNVHDAAMLHRRLEVYAEFPPIHRPVMTRWGDPFSNYATPEPLLALDDPKHRELLAEATDYTWLCYARLR